MPFKPENLYDCARSIRPHLPDLVGSEAAAIDRQLANFLAQANAGQSVDADILDLLKSNPALRQWASEFLSTEAVSKGFERLPGSSGAVSAPKYVCPQGDYVWYRRSSASPIPKCPTHGALIPAEG